MFEALEDSRIRKILTRTGDDKPWRAEFDRLVNEDTTLTRKSAGEESIKALQRLMVFLGYSTSSSGACVIDGDFGRGTNRGVAQFQVENGIMTPANRSKLCYDCSFRTAQSRITAVPDIRLNATTLDAMLNAAVAAIESEIIALGNLKDALFHLNALQSGQFLSCSDINHRFREYAETAADMIEVRNGVEVQPEWTLAIIRQETAGVVRPRFEQHKFSAANKKNPNADLSELRLRSMSIGLGQIMGFNHERVGTASATEMYSSPLSKQVQYVARFLSRGRSVQDALKRPNPREADYRSVAKYYNGPSYATHFYHERLERWFREFKLLGAQ